VFFGSNGFGKLVELALFNAEWVFFEHADTLDTARAGGDGARCVNSRSKRLQAHSQGVNLLTLRLGHDWRGQEKIRPTSP
jgi:hypothetical protein